jgi:hypothetical protein
LPFLRGFASSREVLYFSLLFDDGEEVRVFREEAEEDGGGWGRSHTKTRRHEDTKTRRELEDRNTFGAKVLRGRKIAHAKARRREGIQKIEIHLFSLPFLRVFMLVPAEYTEIVLTAKGMRGGKGRIGLPFMQISAENRISASQHLYRHPSSHPHL